MLGTRARATVAALGLTAAGLLTVAAPAAPANAGIAQQRAFYFCATIQFTTPIYSQPGVGVIGTATKGDLFYQTIEKNGYTNGYDESNGNLHGWVITSALGGPFVLCHAP